MKKLAVLILASTLAGYWWSPIPSSGKTTQKPQNIRLQTDQDPDQPDEKIYDAKDVDQKVSIVSKPKPDYTHQARRNNVVGVVSLRTIFTSKGEVRVVEAQKQLPAGLTENAKAAARNITFTPAMKDGQPVSVWLQLEYNFDLGILITRGQHFPKVYYDKKCRDYWKIPVSTMVFFVDEEHAKQNGYKKSKICP